MKKTFKNWLLPVAVAASAVVYWHCQQVPAQSGPADLTRAAAAPPAPAPQYTGLSSTFSSANKDFDFNFGTDVTALIDNNDVEDDDDWRVFANFGDGTFWMGLKSDFDDRTFTYGAVSSPSYKVYAEVTPTYDDGDKPPGRAAPANITVSTGQTSSSGHQRSVFLATGKSVKLQSNRSPSRGDIITYIITYQHRGGDCPQDTRGDLIFHYDAAVMKPENATNLTGLNLETHHGESVQLGSASTSANGNTGIVHLKFDNLRQGEQRNIFLRFETQDTVSPSTRMNPPWVAYSDTLKERPTGTACALTVQDTSNMQYQVVVASHDPNQKFGVEESIARTADSVTFTVMFQNEGPDSTRKVVVYDELDPFLNPAVPRLVSWSTPNKPTTSISNRTVKFHFGSLQVRGLGEPDYGIKFGEDSTMEVFTFRCAVIKQTPLNTDPDPNVVEQRPCNAICNQAWVVFDCNPPYPTNVAKVPIRCYPAGPSSSPAPPAFIANPLCTEYRDTLNFDSLSTNSFLLSPTQLTKLLAKLPGNTNDKYKWYPSENLVDPFVLNPMVRNPSFSKPPPHQYVLVASQPCERRIVHVNLPSICKMSIIVTPQFSGGGGCSSGQITSLQASVMDANTPAGLKWHNCSTIGSTFTTPIDPNQNEYYFGVTDTITGCSAEVLYKLSSTSGGGGGGGGPWGSVLVAGLVAVIGALLYAVFKKK